MDERYEEAMNKFLAGMAYSRSHHATVPHRDAQKVLVTWESKHGSTAEVSYVIAGALRERGLNVTLAPVDRAEMSPDYDAYVIGSAVYAGHWMKRARQFVRDNRNALLSRPVWLFSSGPVGRPPTPDEATVDIPELFECTAPREHKIFAGKLDRARLSFPEKAIVLALHVPDGDFRDWEEIRQWAIGIAQALAPEEVRV